METDQRRRVRTILGSVLPDPLRTAGARARDRVRELAADRAFRNRSLRDRSPAVSDSAPDHVVCLVVDALRADVVDPDLTPFCADLAGTTAVTPSPWTFPSVASLLTGRYPHEHGAMRGTDDPDDATADEFTLPPALDDDLRTLPEWFAAAGYETYGAFAFYMPFLVARGRFGTHRIYRSGSAERVLEEYRTWVGDRTDNRTFAYLHLGDLHAPVDPPDRYWRRLDVDREIPNLRTWPDPEGGGDRYREHRRRLYRAATAFVDDEIAELVEHLRSAGIEPSVLVTGDHGEAFWEHAAFDAEHFYDSRGRHCVGHGGTPYESIAQVPLVGTDAQFERPASLVDVAPTLLAEVGVDPPAGSDGVVHPGGTDEERVLLLEGTRYGHEKKATYLRDWKLLVSVGDDCRIGFSLPEESPTDLPEEVRTRLADELPAWPENTGRRTVSDDVERRLERLGYR